MIKSLILIITGIATITLLWQLGLLPTGQGNNLNFPGSKDGSLYSSCVDREGKLFYVSGTKGGTCEWDSPIPIH